MKIPEVLDRKHLLIAILLVISLQLIAAVAGMPNVNDPFHTGEYFASATNLIVGGESAYRAIQIHGLNDVLPALMTEAIWGADNHFVPTLAIYRALNFSAFLLLLLAAFQVSSKNSDLLFILLSIALVGTSFVSFRDVLLIACINLFLVLQRQDLKRSVAFTFQVMFGTVAAFAIFWSFDRGIAGTIALGIASLLALRSDKKFLVALATFGCSVIVLPYVHDVFSLSKYLDNLLILIETSSQWSYGLKVGPILLSSFVLYLNLFAVLAYLICIWRKISEPSVLPNAALFLILTIFMLKIGTNRADLGHIYQAHWVPLFLILLALKNCSSLDVGKQIVSPVLAIAAIGFLFPLVAPLFGSRPYVSAITSGILLIAVLKLTGFKRTNFAVAGLLLLCVFPFGYLAASLGYKAIKGEYVWLASLKSPPTNVSISPEGVIWASEKLVQNEASCIFDLSNNGVINALARLPSCTKFTYPVYAGPQHETLMIDELKKNKPRAIIYSSTYWSYNIDGRNMVSRFPKLDDYILEHYSGEECQKGYCVRYVQR